MFTSIFIAKIIAVLYLSLGFGMLFNTSYYEKAFQNMFKDSLHLFFGGIFSLICGLFLIEYHNIWVKDWMVVITIFGWIAVVKGVMLFIFPKSFEALKGMFNQSMMKTFLIPGVLLLGSFFAYFGFFA